MNPLSRAFNAIADRLAPAEAKASDAVEHFGDDLPPLGPKTTKSQATGETQAAARVPKEKIAEKGESLSQKAIKWGNRAKGAALFALGKAVSGTVAFGGAVRGLADRREINLDKASDIQRPPINLDKASDEDKEYYKECQDNIKYWGGCDSDTGRLPDGSFTDPDIAKSWVKTWNNRLLDLEDKIAKEQGIEVGGKTEKAPESKPSSILQKLQDMGRACFSKIGGSQAERTNQEGEKKYEIDS